MKITITKLLILVALVLAVPAIGGRAVFAQVGQGGSEIPAAPTEETSTEAAPTTEAEPGADGGGDGGGAEAAPAGDGTGADTEATGAAAAKDAVCEGIALTGGECDAAADQGGLDNIIKQAINVLSVVIGIICVVMIMIGGLKYITSSGDANSLTSAKNTILYALVGLVIVAFAQTIVRFILSWL